MPLTASQAQSINIVKLESFWLEWDQGPKIPPLGLLLGLSPLQGVLRLLLVPSGFHDSYFENCWSGHVKPLSLSFKVHFLTSSQLSFLFPVDAPWMVQGPWFAFDRYLLNSRGLETSLEDIPDGPKGASPSCLSSQTRQSSDNRL